MNESDDQDDLPLIMSRSTQTTVDQRRMIGAFIAIFGASVLLIVALNSSATKTTEIVYVQQPVAVAVATTEKPCTLPSPKCAISANAKFDVSHIGALDYFKHDPYLAGPLQIDEQLFLFSIVRMVRPRTIVELGYLLGDSAFNFLQAMRDSPDARLYSFDIDCGAFSRLQNDQQWRGVCKSQTDITRADIDNRAVDFLFIDAEHNLELNMRTLQRVLDEGILAPDALIAIHDTGLWAADRMENTTMYIPQRNEYWPVTRFVESDPLADENAGGKGYAHQIDERRFVNWIQDAYPGRFHVLHMHTLRTVRHGITLLQQYRPLVV